MNTLNWKSYLGKDGLFIKAFKPLREQLNRQANELGIENLNWLIKSGKGGDVPYLYYHDISLYRHCMDVATVAFMLFVHAWQNNKAPHPEQSNQFVAPDDEATAEQLVRTLFAIAFMHDADKYVGAELSSSPNERQLQQLHADLAIEQWANLSLPLSLTLVSMVETTRGKGTAIMTGVRPTLNQYFLGELVGWSDGIVSAGSELGYAAIVESYNKHLAAFSKNYGIPITSLKLVSFQYDPVILAELQDVFIKHFYDHNYFPLVCILEGRILKVSLPENYPLLDVFDELRDRLSFQFPTMDRIQNTGEVVLSYVKTPAHLIKAVGDFKQAKAKSYTGLLSIKSVDKATVKTLINRWINEYDLVAAQESEGAFIQTILPSQQEHEIELYALVISAALRGIDPKTSFSEKLLNQRTQQLLQNYPEIAVKLQEELGGIELSDLQKDTQQAVLAMLASELIDDQDDLEAMIAVCQGDFPVDEATDEGINTIITQLTAQCGLAQPADNEWLYATAPKAGTCVICSAPADTEISQKLKTNIKTSAFYNGIGHRKSIWSQAGINYLCPACIKQQELTQQRYPKLSGKPLLVATPFRGLISANLEEVGVESVLSSYDVHKNWQYFLPWNMDLNHRYPLSLEEEQSEFQEQVKALYRWAKFALITGNATHLFIAAQRDCKATLLFEQMPPLINTLLLDLVVKTEDIAALPAEVKAKLQQRQLLDKLTRQLPYEQNTWRRNRLIAVVERLKLFVDLLGFHEGFQALSAMTEYGWWPVAWLAQREPDSSLKKKSLKFMLDIAQEQYPMTNSTLTTLAESAAAIQRYPGWEASNSDKRFCLTLALEQYEIGVNHQLDKETIVAAIAGVLADTLLRREMHTGGNSQFPARCQAFGEIFYDFVTQFSMQKVIDPRFQRFLLAAYAHLFMQTSLAHSKANKEKYANSQAELISTEN
ncbi:hypothetical protein [Thioflexithrix psekupsensis]|uniref:Type I-D CRISPR-associated protein Cas10d/Csc3 n=1 Tax=Thioflexithrix psekupsensis TaxID=1570016 RepID=A0A251X6I2_9GAMM|nr:hypothetical protein [Thioflexithrix psekupsensis]OUD13071.1 hypothetical protein TPSD3_10495 [Thioflexithrix psekupsensis]